MLRFKADTPTRKALFVGDAMSHPAKGQLGMWQEMILRYSKEGEYVIMTTSVLDAMDKSQDWCSCNENPKAKSVSGLPK